jgi:RNA polymerase sigma factor (TIGR02999 family)
MSEHDCDSNITQLLNLYGGGDKVALEQLSPLIYIELQQIARRLFSSESAGHTLQPTALVNEAFMKLVEIDVSWQDRAHFYALAARLMRRLLVDHAKSKHADKRGGLQNNLTLNTKIGSDNDMSEVDMLALHDAIEKLAEQDERKALLIELQYFGGLNFEEMALVSGLSSSSIDRELRFSRAWLKAQLSENSAQ